MMKKSSRPILLYPALAMLFGVMALPAGFAREPSHPKGTRNSAHHATPGSTKKGEVNMPISVQRGGRSDHDNAATGPKTFKIVPSNHVHIFATKPSAGSSVVGRNAIGLPIVRPKVVRPDNGLPFSHLPTQPSGSPASGVSRFANRNLPTTQFAVPHASPPRANLGSGKIDGTVLIRHPAPGVGGPSASVGGINGTAFRPKH